jgi:DNA sulfur modification protein DndD
MSFHFRRLFLKDWLVYGGTTELQFSDVEPGQNIVTIHGKNGFGKTSLLRALEFLFHDNMGRQEYFSHWHDRARDNGEGSMEVALEFDYESRPYKLIRKVEFKPRGEESIFAYSSCELFNIEEGEVEDQAQDKIELMIPEKSQQFVFFDGAEILRYAQKQHEEGVRDAIERMLGIPAVRNLEYDLDKLIDTLEDEQARIALLEGQSNELLEEIDELQRELGHYREEKKSKEEKLRSVQRSSQELERETAQISKIEAQQNELREKQQRLADYEERRDEKKAELDNYIETAPLRLLKEPLTQIVQEAQAKSNGGGSRRRAYVEQQAFLESLLENEDCICGREITSDAANRIEEKVAELKQLSEGLKQSTSDSFLSITELTSLSATLQQFQNSKTNGEDLFDSLSAIDDRIEEIETDIRRLRRDLEGHEDTDIAESMRLQRELGERAGDLRNEIESLEENIGRVAKLIDEKQRELDETTTGTQEGDRVTRTLRTARNLHAAVQEYVSEMVERKQEKIQANASDIFKGITNKPEEYAGVRVKEDYTLEVYRHDSTTVPNEKLSPGEKEVLAYSFITALNLSSVNPAPFVMDTPFGHLDSTHRDRLLQSLPQLDVQVFLLATDRDLPPKERDRIQPYLADEFVIERDQTRARSTIEPA